ncbi:Endonuclease/exonuclease/phosphatase superfamily [Arabidopsis suecica]|uniref:Endonuclease/exonuclease/phosphatase superfamily n=1 Tax=Arabidopsis suecica TaxID=45249 RepID=A0A8T2AID2_ARASU|nr:Endonuclease/exonuclease/phosphatase superfamily [Arabidopsis suecica]KAG7573304.1 Endonuclease/exonuclease/phosphatase superfamily [Arabidopsis suecica]KAG7573305.1 Endonuclease/exonuclease/phosphatase superfamily [Arabidopsis suecica]
MRDDKSKKSKLSWSKKMVRKWFNIKSKTEKFQADVSVPQGVEVEHKNSFSEREPCTIKKSKTEKLNKNWEQQARQRKMNYENPRIIDVQNHSIFVATWNVAGRSPPEDLNLDEWLHSSAPADIYVLGFQEIVPLNAGNVLGAEDNGPAKKWHSLIRKTLNNLPGTSSVCHTPSPIPVPIAEIDADFSGSSRQKNETFFNRRSFQTPSVWSMEENDPSISQPRLDRRFSVCDRVFFSHRPSDFDPSFRCSHRPSDYSRRPSDYSRPSDYYSRPSNYSRPSDVSRWGSSDDDNGPGDSPSTLLNSPGSCLGSASTENGYRIPWNSSQYCLVASKQMVGIFLTIWVKSELREHVKNMKVSCVGRGLMGYLGNKGSISISMLLHQTSFCFVCTHLTSGQKEGDELRRNSDVMEILKKTRFPRVQSSADEKSPENILQHDRVIWLGDLNYRIALSYRSAKALVEMQNWRALLENDQLRIEQKRGHVFKGWNEGKIYFPPTYKYSNNSDRYAGGDLHPKEKRRTPAWCDRILWHGEGLHQLSYVRGESRFSDHRPVYGIFSAEVESNHKRLKRTTSHSTARVEAEELLPYARGYTELTFF